MSSHINLSLAVNIQLTQYLSLEWLIKKTFLQFLQNKKYHWKDIILFAKPQHYNPSNKYQLNKKTLPVNSKFPLEKTFKIVIQL